jgi:RNA polymerase-binding transcription factor DksA
VPTKTTTTRNHDPFRRRLQELAERLRQDISAVSEDARRASGGQAAGELTNVPHHLGDMASDEFQHDLSATLLQNEEYLSDEVQAARQRLDSGRFGICEHCGKPIPVERLDAIPYARYCTPCAEQANGDIANFDSGRPRSPADTIAGHIPPGPADVPEGVESPANAIGTAGGGTAIGGLAGSTEGHGDPAEEALEQATAGSHFDVEDARPPDQEDEASEVVSH